jgi:predicted dehydrogenase
MARLLNAAIVGTGNAAVMHATAMRALPDAAVLAVCSRDRARAAEFARKHHIPRHYGELSAMLADPEVDAVHICTPPFLHADQALAALTAGKHVIIDKPIARTVAEARTITAAATATRLTLGGVFQKRFMPLPLQVKAAIDGGAIGDLVMADAYLKWWRDDSYFAGSPWRGTRIYEGGGALINQGIHIIDLLLWLAGPVNEVSGAVATRVHPIEMEDSASAVLRFAGGAIGVIQASTAAWPGFPERVELHGAEGSIALNEGIGAIDWRLRGSEPHTTADSQPGASGASDPNAISLLGHTAQFMDFYAAIRERRQPLVSASEATRALELIQAIRLSSSRRATVRLPLTADEAATVV